MPLLLIKLALLGRLSPSSWSMRLASQPSKLLKIQSRFADLQPSHCDSLRILASQGYKSIGEALAWKNVLTKFLIG